MMQHLEVMGGVCRNCGQWPELYFGQWVPHKPGDCPLNDSGVWLG